MTKLFDIFLPAEIKKDLSKKIKGLTVIPNYIDSKQAQAFVAYLDKQPWSTGLLRRVQQYGYAYIYGYTDGKAELAPPIPAIFDNIRDKLVQDGYFPRKPDQMIINEYVPGQGIGWHIDRTDVFGDTIATLSLLCEYPMEFRHKAERYTEYLPVKSMTILKDDARYVFQHSIIPRAKDRTVTRRRRVSVTFRLVIQ